MLTPHYSGFRGYVDINIGRTRACVYAWCANGFFVYAPGIADNTICLKIKAVERKRVAFNDAFFYSGITSILLPERYNTSPSHPWYIDLSVVSSLDADAGYSVIIPL